MRRLVISENLALDGVMESPETWFTPYGSSDIAEVVKQKLMATDALLLGRVTYQHLAAYWPFQADDESGIPQFLNNVAKFVVSSTLKETNWHNTTILNGDVAKETSTLKQQDGKNIVVLGSGVLVQSLMQHDLIDEYELFVAPVVMGSGKPLFPDGIEPQTLQLIEAKPFSSGVVLLRYQPAQQH